MKRVAVTGAGGFAGAALAAALESRGSSVVGIGRGRRPDAWRGPWQVADVRDGTSVDAAVAAARPDVVFHLAGTRGGSTDELRATHVRGLANVLDAVDRHARGAPVVVVGSSAEVAAAGRPVTDYGRSKLEQSELADRRGAIRARTFNLIGPGLPDAFAAGAFARALAEVAAGGREPVLHTGPLATARDLVDVRDAARAWIALADAPPGGAYDVCTGTATTTASVLATLIRLSGLAIEVDEPPAPRHDDVLVQVGDPSRTREATGWRAEIPLERSLADLLTSWRVTVAQTT